MNIHEENSAYRFQVQSEREHTLEDCIREKFLDIFNYLNVLVLKSLAQIFLHNIKQTIFC